MHLSSVRASPFKLSHVWKMCKNPAWDDASRRYKPKMSIGYFVLIADLLNGAHVDRIGDAIRAMQT
ncbi:MAG: hypothetical protein LBR08_05435 [Bacteroidales bacterium]|nr:hypothetical protein [Bacteroidales bacterium]